GNDVALRPAEVEAAALGQKAPALELFQVVPPLEGAVQQRDVVGMLEIRLADDARLAVRAAAVVHQAELLQAEHAPAAAGQLEQRRTAHAADAEHDRVITGFVHG